MIFSNPGVIIQKHDTNIIMLVHVM